MDEEEERSTRYSSRKNTMLNRIQVEDQMREHRKKKALQPKRERPVVNKLTQEELLAEAAITEEQNKHSLLEWQQKEAERKENAKKKEKKSITGTFVRYYSFADGNPKIETSNLEGIADNSINSNDWQNELMGRNLISFMDSKESGIATQVSSGTETADTDKDLGLVDLIDQLSSWLDKEPKPNKPVLCPVSGEIARYRDPHTNVPYANIHAYELIKSCLHHDMKWSSSSGLYLGQLPSAKGVPDGWNSSN
jgi:vacuolar protein sorting-associated protein 72